MPGALEGIRVIDFGQYIAGPLAAQLLGDQGADVIRVDPPGGPMWDTPANATWNRGKRSIVIDLKRDEDREVARRLVASADVVIENFRPGVMDRLGLGAEACTAANPALIYCSLPGFAPDDPRAGTRAWVGVVGAAAATYRRVRTGGEAGRPLYTAIPLASSYAAIQAAVAIAMALAARERDGIGQHITVPLFDAMFGAIGYNGLGVHNADGPARLGGLGLTTQFECADGRWVMFHTGNTRTAQVLEAAGVGHWVAEGVTDRKRLADDPALAEDFLHRARELFKTRTADEWEALVSAAGGECAVCRESAEWIEHPHALGSETIVEVDDPVLGHVKQAGIPARMTLTPPAVGGPRRPLDADRASILAELEAQRPAPRPAPPVEGTLRAALEGVRVIDLCMVLAGPTCGRTLAEYGADVVKIEPPMRPPNDTFHLDVNRGKRNIVLHLGTPEGLEVFWRLVDRADVVVQNFRKGGAERLGIGYEQVRARRPDIVYASINTYGQIGPFAGRPGHEQIAQAATGMQARFGGDGQPRLQNYAVNDYGTGYLGAYAIALGLLHRQRTGEGQHVDAALAYTATLLQSAFMLDYEGKRWAEPRGTDAVGSGLLHRAYAASDGWLFLGARERDLPALANVEGMAGVEGLRGEPLEAALEQRFPKATVAQWVEQLVGAGIGAHRVINDTRELMDDPWAVEHGLSITRDHDGQGLVTTTGPAPRLSRTPVVPGRPAPPVGGDVLDVLRELGMDELAGALPQKQGAL
jgi:crotonobetainyl-CoA:carnitine CoA-transferase CaiB-like acyl-CoA transferase